MPPTQSHRLAAIRTPLGPDVLLLEHATFDERLGRLFEIEAELISTQGDIPFERIVGQNVTLRLETAAGMRYWNGYVSRFAQGDAEGSFPRYRATIVPWFWFLTRSSDCRIFQPAPGKGGGARTGNRVPDIVKQVFRLHRFDAYRDALAGRYDSWEYCVQYRESAFNFCSRLLEQEGIYYYFEHEDGAHRLVLADSPGVHRDGAGYEALAYRVDGQGHVDREYVRRWSRQCEVQPGGYALNDFNPATPRSSLVARAQARREHAQSGLAMYDYPGEYEEFKGGRQWARLRLEELQAAHEVYQGETNARGLAAGSVFELTGHPRRDFNRRYLVTGTLAQVAGQYYETQEEGTSVEPYSCRFSAIPVEVVYRPPRLTPKPVVQGPQTAMVVGPKGKEVYIDSDARVKVQFHWDRYGRSNEHSSCWIRVAQPWAGGSYGGVAIPRVGHEVVVEFLEGDPDRPIINGRVYNGKSRAGVSKAGKHLKVKAPPGEAGQAVTARESVGLGGGGASAVPPSSGGPHFTRPLVISGAGGHAPALTSQGLEGVQPGGGEAMGHRPGGGTSDRQGPKPVGTGAVGGPGHGSLGGEGERPGALDRPGAGGEYCKSGAGEGGKMPPPLKSFQHALGYESLRAAFTGDVETGAGAGGGQGEGGMKGFSDPPAEMLHTSFRSDSVGASGDASTKTGGHNEITMNDAAGEESLYVKAQYDNMVEVGNNRSTQVGVNSFELIGSNRVTEVGVDSAEKVGSNLVQEIGANATLKVGANRDENVGVNDTLKVGTAKVVDVGETILIKAGTSITLQCGASTIHMNQAGFITISGTIISVAAAVNAAIVAPLTEVVGAAMLAEAGGLIKIFGGVTHVGAAGMTKVSGASVFSEAKASNVTSGATVASVASGPNIVQGATVKLN